MLDKSRQTVSDNRLDVIARRLSEKNVFMGFVQGTLIESVLAVLVQLLCLNLGLNTFSLR